LFAFVVFVSVSVSVSVALVVAFAPWRICLKCSFQCRQVSAKAWATVPAAGLSQSDQEIGNVKAKSEKKNINNNTSYNKSNGYV